jgi:hypothetical protein
MANCVDKYPVSLISVCVFFFLGGVGVKPVDSSEVIVGVSYGACALSRGFLVV